MEILMGAIISAIVGVIGIIISHSTATSNKKSQEDINEKNIEAVKEQNEANEALTREAWDRDDNAMQRKAADLAAAGLSPHLAAGGAGSGVSQPIQMQAPQQTAPQMNYEGLSSMLGMISNLGPRMAEQKQTEAQTKLLAQQYGFNEVKQRQMEMQVEIQGKLIPQMDTNLNIANKNLEILNHNLAYATAHNLPVGQREDALIHRIERAIDTMMNIKEEFGEYPAKLLHSAQNKVEEVRENIDNTISGIGDTADKMKQIYTNPYSTYGVLRNPLGLLTNPYSSYGVAKGAVGKLRKYIGGKK